MPRTEVIHVNSLGGIYLIECLYVTFGKVYDVDIIPDARAVFGGIVVAEHIEVVELAYGNPVRYRARGYWEYRWGPLPMSPLTCAPMGLK